MQRSLGLLVALVGLLASGSVLADYDVKVDLKNVSGEVKTDWPVVLRVYTVLGRNLPAGSVNPEGFHVYDPAGKEVPHWIEVIPPADQPGNDEIIFVVPRMEPAQTLSYRITNTKDRSPARAERPVDLVTAPHNLLGAGKFIGAKPAVSSIPPTPTRRGQELALQADGATVTARYEKPVPLHKGSWYYFGAWSKTDNVSRFGYEAGEAAHFRFTARVPATEPATRPQDYKDAQVLGSVTPQCSTRDWLKATFQSDCTDWGVDRYVSQAQADQAAVEFVLDQRKHYYMEPGKTQGTWVLDSPVLLEQPEVTVRFDLSVAPLVKDGVFLFTRSPVMPLGKLVEQEYDRQNRQWKPIRPYRTQWAARPFAHERLERFDRFALKGQRVSFCLGLYHTRAMKDVLVGVEGGALEGPDGSRIPLETLEYCPGYLGPDPSRYMPILGSGSEVQPVTPAGDTGVRYFFLTFAVPRDARAGRYTGKVRLLEKDSPLAEIPVTLRVQDLAQPVLRDIYVGLIYNGGLPNVDDMLKQYARSGFSCITWFYGWMPYEKDGQGRVRINAQALEGKMKQLLDLGVTAGVGLYTDIQLDDKPNNRPGRLIRLINEEMAAARSAATKAAATTQLSPEQQAALPTKKQIYFRVMKELDALAKAHPEWPRVVYMNWDEPPPFNEQMGWTNQATPDAISTLDVQFGRLPRVMQYYNTPAFDDPANWAGPELYRWVGRQGKNFGLCGATDTAEPDRYQPGMFMITSGAIYFHAWHIRGGHTPGQMAWDESNKRTIRGHEMIAWAGGMDDLKTYRLLKDAMDQAKKSGKSPAAVKAAEEYLAKVFAVWNGDHKDRWSLQPYLGTAYEWGYEQFYDDWQEQMARHAAAILGVKWID